jgi:hypothetical protein
MFKMLKGFHTEFIANDKLKNEWKDCHSKKDKFFLICAGFVIPFSFLIVYIYWIMYMQKKFVVGDLACDTQNNSFIILSELEFAGPEVEQNIHKDFLAKIRSENHFPFFFVHKAYDAMQMQETYVPVQFVSKMK